MYYATLINASGEKIEVAKDTKVTVTDGKHSQFDVTHPSNVHVNIALTGRGNLIHRDLRMTDIR